MCGIAGCVGHEQALEFVPSSLQTLEYRGYDSSGIGFIDPAQPSAIEVVRAVGNVTNLLPHIPDTPGVSTAIGHNRWATHGQVLKKNAHPHTNASATIAVVQNGVIENFQELRDSLNALGYEFSSDTDTEIIPHLIDYYQHEGRPFDAAFESAMRDIEGAYAVLAINRAEPETMYAARLGAPLLLAVNGVTRYAASGLSVFSGKSQQVIQMQDYDVARITAGTQPEFHNLKTRQSVTRQLQEFAIADQEVKLGDFPHYMLKEIHDSPDVVRAALSGRVDAESGTIKLSVLHEQRERLRDTKRLIMLGCGTSYHAGLVGKRLFEELAGIPVEVALASEFKDSQRPFEKDTTIVAISQSGETADTIAALKKTADHGLLSIGVINSPGSDMSQLVDGGVYCRAGSEVSVASTKAFTSQVTVLAELALALGQQSSPKHKAIIEALPRLPDNISALLRDTRSLQRLAKHYAHNENFLYIGRGYEYASALEGALKLKEISYIHAEGCGAGEMKHGILALIDEDFPTLAIATDSESYAKTISNIAEIKARGGPVIALACEGNESIADHVDDVLYVPKTVEQLQPIINGVALQLFAYYIAAERGTEIDRPRNLAKAVTVE